MIRNLQPVMSAVILVRPKTDRSRDMVTLRNVVDAARVPVLYEGSVQGGVTLMKRSGRSLGTVLITGSHFVVGEASAALAGKKYLTINQ